MEFNKDRLQSLQHDLDRLSPSKTVEPNEAEPYSSLNAWNEAGNEAKKEINVNSYGIGVKLDSATLNNLKGEDNNMEKKANYYFTFMGRQTDLKNKYVKINDTYLAARGRMCAIFSDQWAFQYTEEEFLPQIEEYGLTELPLEEGIVPAEKDK